MSTGHDIDLVPPTDAQDRNWLPLVISASLVLFVAAVVVLLYQHGRAPATVAPITTPLDPYAGRLPISGLVMSESGNLAGGKVTYVDGQIANTGNKTVTGVTVQVLFRDAAKEVTQNETHLLKLIRTREPYVDVEPVSAAPIKPGEQRDFRLIFDAVSPDWDGAYPQIRIIHIETE